MQATLNIASLHAAMASAQERVEIEAARALYEDARPRLDDTKLNKLYLRLLRQAGDLRALEDFAVRLVDHDPDNLTAIRVLLRVSKGLPVDSKRIDYYAGRRDEAAGHVWLAAQACRMIAAGEDQHAWKVAKAALVREAPEPVRKTMRSAISGLFSWYGRQDLAEHLILRGRGGKELFDALRELVDLRRTASFDDTTKTYYRFLIENPNPWQAQSARNYLTYLWRCEGATRQLLEDSGRWSGLFSTADRAAFEALRAALALEIGDERRAVFLILDNPASAACHALLPVAALVQRESRLKSLLPAEQQDVSTEHALLHNSICAATAALEDEIRRAARMIAIVGNSGCELGQGKGAAIDGRPLIFRFNKAPQSQGYGADYGVRTDVHVMHAKSTTEGEAAKDARFVMFTTSYCLALNNNWTNARDLIRRGKQVVCVPGDSYSQLANKLGAPPSAGIRVCYYVKRVLGHSLTPDNLFGISLTDQIGEHPKSAHYFEQARPSQHHDWKKERKLLNRMILGGNP